MRGWEAVAARGATSGTALRVGVGWCRWRVLAMQLQGWEVTAGPKCGLGSVSYPREIPGTVIFWFGANRGSPDQLISGSVQLLDRCPESYRIKCKKAVQHVRETVAPFVLLSFMGKKKLVDEDFSGSVWSDVLIKSI